MFQIQTSAAYIFRVGVFAHMHPTPQKKNSGQMLEIFGKIWAK